MLQALSKITRLGSEHVDLVDSTSGVRHLALGEDDGTVALPHRRLDHDLHLAEVVAQQVGDSNPDLRRSFGDGGRGVEGDGNGDVELVLGQDLEHLEEVISSLGL